MALNSVALQFFQTWQAGYGGKLVSVYRAGTTDLLTVYSDPLLTNDVPNPIVLATQIVGGTAWGKWAQPYYVGEAYYIAVAGETSGVVQVVVTDFAGADVSQSLAKTRRGGFLREIQDFLDNEVYVEDYGPLGVAGVSGSSPATNSATIQTAIGAVAGQGGGSCILPAGSYEFTTLAIPQNVWLIGQGRGATIIMSGQGEDVITLTGQGAGLADLTLDGLNLFPHSVGVKMVGIESSNLSRMEIKRFETGILARGNTKGLWKDLWVKNCIKGSDIQGNLDTANTGLGGPVQFNVWEDGIIEACTTFGLSLSYDDAIVEQNFFRGISFQFNSGTALLLNGPHFTKFENCNWLTNTTHVDIHDDDVTLPDNSNKVIDLAIIGGELNEGEVRATGRAQDVVFDRVEFVKVDFLLNQPENALLLVDSIESADVTVSGATIKLMRWRRNDRGELYGITSDATPVTAWERSMLPGEVGFAIAEVVANRRNGWFYAAIYVAVGARRPGSVLNYDAQTGNFSLGATLTGQTSNATGLIVEDADAGTTGTLKLRGVVGAFLDNEPISDGISGSALANGTLVSQTATLDAGGNTYLRPTASPLGSLAYDAQTANFTVGLVLTGGSSGATGKIESDTDAGTTGTLVLSAVTGTFQDNETITDTGAGSATANGTLTTNAGYTAAFIVSGGELQLKVTGLVGHTVDWTARVTYLASH